MIEDRTAETTDRGPMALDREACDRARRARDPRFDGRFYIGVLTTGIYCRPICPVQPPRSENVRFFQTAAAAEEAGLRACLRCRPECAPGSPAWLGTGATVTRALRLIEEGALDHDSVAGLARRLGVGERHLRRLFARWVGASPAQVQRTRRLHLAKRLLSDSDLAMSDVALAAGFGSIRRFNDAVRSSWQRTPSDLRRAARPNVPRRRAHSGLEESGTVLELQLPFREPFAWDDLLKFLAKRATPGVERVTSGRYLRSIVVEGQVGWLEVERSPVPGHLVTRLGLAAPRPLLQVAERLRGMFDLYADPAEIGTRLAPDPLMADRLRRHPGLRIPGAWDGFELVVRAVLGQQVSVKGATTLAGRLAERYGQGLPASARREGVERLFPTPERLAGARASGGMPESRWKSIRALARAVANGELDLSPSSDPAVFVEQLQELPGIGPWTASYVAMRLLHDPDAFPSGDLVLRQRLAAGDELPNEEQMNERAQRWRPWRAYAAMLLWTDNEESE